jgi:ADP-heptose:LPS heptosyltransferase
MPRNSSALRRVLVVRNDKLGDFTLALPAFALLKQQLPEAEVAALVPAYTRDVAALCPWIDTVLIDPGRRRELELVRLLRRQRFDAVITLFSTTRVGFSVFAGGIPYRLAPATKAAQFFYNHRLVQRRSRSEKPEFEYNLDLVQRFLCDWGIQVQNTPVRRPYLAVEPGESAQRKAQFRQRHGVREEHRLVFLHPGSGGSANNLSLEQYAQLARGLRSRKGHTVVISSGPGEEALGDSLAAVLPDVPHVRYISREGLTRFVQTLAICDVFISGSTGPLHLAGALDRPTVGFYPRRRSATPLRWQTLNEPERRLAYCPPASGEETDMSTIDVEAAAAEISARFLGAAETPA